MIEYIVKECKDPMNPEITGKYYAKRVARGTVTPIELAQRISAVSGHSRGAVLGMIEDIMAAAVHFMKKGCNVELGDHSRFQLALSTELADDEKKVNVTNIRKVYVRYINSMVNLGTCSFQRVYRASDPPAVNPGV